MSVSRTDYFMIGYELPKDFITSNNHDDYELYTDNYDENQLTIIYDFMNGDFCYVGLVINKSNSHSGFDFNEMNLKEIMYLSDKCYKLVQKDSDFNKIIESLFPKILVFTQWS